MNTSKLQCPKYCQRGLYRPTVLCVVFTLIAAGNSFAQIKSSSGASSERRVSTASEKFALSDGNLTTQLRFKMMKTNGYFYATKKISNDCVYYYFVILIYDSIDFEMDNIQFKASVKDGCVDIEHNIVKQNRKFKMSLSECIKTSKTLNDGKLIFKIGEKPIDLNLGNVFVIDFTAADNIVKQSKVTLPSKECKGTDEEAELVFNNILRDFKKKQLDLKPISP